MTNWQDKVMFFPPPAQERKGDGQPMYPDKFPELVDATESEMPRDEIRLITGLNVPLSAVVRPPLLRLVNVKPEDSDEAL